MSQPNNKATDSRERAPIFDSSPSANSQASPSVGPNPGQASVHHPLPLEWLLQPKVEAASKSERILARLIQCEAHEPNPSLKSDYRQSFITVALAEKDHAAPFVEASYRMYGVHPDKLFAHITAMRKEKLGAEYGKWFDANGQLLADVASPKKPARSVPEKDKFKRQRGQAILEAAIMLPILVFIALAMIDMQWALSDAGTLDYVVSEAARCEALSALPCTAGNNAGSYAVSLAANLKLTASRFSVVSFGCDPMVGSCTVVATYNYPPIGVWFPSILISRTGTAAITTAPQGAP